MKTLRRRTRHPDRIHPWLALRAFLEVARDPENTQAGARFVFALEGRHSDELFERFRRDPEGARILRERRSLRPSLSDREALRALPEGTLGRAYLQFVETERISAEGLAAATAPSTSEFLDTRPARRLLHDRISDMHDLWHVVTGYSRDLIGELALIGFSHVQLGTPAFRILLALSRGAELRAPGTRALIVAAQRRAREAPWLVVVDWEWLLEKPLAEVRQELRLGEPPVYTRYFRVGRRLVAEREAARPEQDAA